MSTDDLMMEFVWVEGDAKYFASTHRAHPVYAKRLRAYVTDDDLTALSKLAKQYTDLNQFMLESANLGTIAASHLAKGGKCSTAAFKNASGRSLRDQIRALAPHATVKQLRAMNEIVDETANHLNNPKP